MFPEKCNPKALSMTTTQIPLSVFARCNPNHTQPTLSGELGCIREKSYSQECESPVSIGGDPRGQSSSVL